ncbi:MAG: hypothetical protein M5U01_33195 [Ardenticatenaceae bacterium]|nr:hypothetical protein [Ardenticatenaceae bacterium]
MPIDTAGQFDEAARFQVRGATGTMWLAEKAVWMAVVEQTPPQPLPDTGRGARSSLPLAGEGRGGGPPPRRPRNKAPSPSQGRAGEGVRRLSERLKLIFIQPIAPMGDARPWRLRDRGRRDAGAPRGGARSATGRGWSTRRLPL